MKKLFAIIALLWSVSADALTAIDSTTWNNVQNASKNIIMDCDCSIVNNPDGTQTVMIKSVRHIHKVGGQISCVVASPYQFFSGMANNPQSLYSAMLNGGGNLWISSDNGVTWESVVTVPGKLFPQMTLASPDPWCIGK